MSLFDIKGKTAIIAGASGAFGALAAKTLAGAGANVVLAASKAEELKKVAAECEKLGAKAEIIALRPSSEENCDKIVKAAVDKFGRVDILVVASGLNKVSKIVDQKVEDFLDVMDANVNQSWLMARAAGKQMLKQGQGGKVILTSSARGLLGHPAGYTAYCASKSAVDGITKALGCEWGETGITVNALGPTVFRSPLTAWMYEDTGTCPDGAKGLSRTRAEGPAGRAGGSRGAAAVSRVKSIRLLYRPYPLRRWRLYAGIVRDAGRNDGKAMSAIIDIYCHIFPDRYFQEMTKVAPNLENIGKRLRGVTKLFDLDARFKEMDEFGDYRQIISLPNPAIEDIARPDVGLNLARIANDAMAELCRKHPERFPAFAAALCMTDVEGSVAEARRAVKDLGARGVLLYTNVAGRPLDDPEFEPIFATMAELDLPIWLHPVGTAAMPDYPSENKSRFEMWWCFHWPYETSVAMVRMVFSGLLDRYPQLKIITHHLGGMIPYYDGRVGPGLKVLGQRTSDEDYSKILPSLKRPHMDYLHDFYADTAMFGGGVAATRCGFEFFRRQPGRFRD